MTNIISSPFSARAAPGCLLRGLCVTPQNTVTLQGRFQCSQQESAEHLYAVSDNVTSTLHPHHITAQTIVTNVSWAKDNVPTVRKASEQWRNLDLARRIHSIRVSMAKSIHLNSKHYLINLTFLNNDLLLA